MYTIADGVDTTKMTARPIGKDSPKLSIFKASLVKVVAEIRRTITRGSNFNLSFYKKAPTDYLHKSIGDNNPMIDHKQFVINSRIQETGNQGSL
jgi:hypothetical protein